MDMKPIEEMFSNRRSARNGQRRQSKAAQKRERLRDALWPSAAESVWSRHSNDGFTTVPRILPLVMHLIKRLAKKGDPSSVYFELWCRAFDEGIVTVSDEMVSAYAAGYSGTRAMRTWREHMLQLQELGFIEVKPAGNREIGHVLILNPLLVSARLYATKPKLVTEEWWSAFVGRANEIGAEIPEQLDRKESKSS